MDISGLTRISDFEWRIEPQGDMRVPGIIFASRALVEGACRAGGRDNVTCAVVVVGPAPPDAQDVSR